MNAKPCRVGLAPPTTNESRKYTRPCPLESVRISRINNAAPVSNPKSEIRNPQLNEVTMP